MKNIAVLGSTGSIGTQTLDVVRASPGRFRITVLACRSRIDLLEKQIREFLPDMAAVFDEDAAADLAVRVRDLPVRGWTG